MPLLAAFRYRFTAISSFCWQPMPEAYRHPSANCAMPVCVCVRARERGKLVLRERGKSVFSRGKFVLEGARQVGL